MKIVTIQETGRYIPEVEVIKGVELNGLTDAVALVGNLGAYAQDAVERPFLPNLFNLKSENKFSAPMLPNRASLAAEALTLQAQLLGQIASGAVGEREFTFRAIDEHAGDVLKAAVELPDTTVASTAERPATRFPKSPFGFDLANLAAGSLFDDIRADRKPLYEQTIDRQPEQYRTIRSPLEDIEERPQKY